MEPHFSKLPPQNLEAEQSVLGSILLKDKTFGDVLEILQPEDFYSPAHRIIYKALVDLFDRNEPLDLVTLNNQLTDSNQIKDIGGAVYLSSLTSIVPVTTNVISYANIIKQKSILRRLIEVNTDIASRCYEEQGEINQLVDDAEQAIFDIAGEKSTKSFTPLKNIIPGAFQKIEQLYQRQEMITGVPTGYQIMDRMTAGLQPSDLIILAGRPSMGKTAFALNLAQNAALIEKTGVAIFSLEMSKEQLATRLICSIGKIDSQRVRTGRLHEEDWPRLTRAITQLTEAPIYIDDTPGITILEMRSKVRRLAAQYPIGLIVVDYLQLMQGRNSENRTQEISEISRSLKALAKEHSVPVIALSQLNRGVDARSDRRPLMSDLRESGAIEQDADIILFIYRDEVYNKEPTNPKKGTAEIIIGKQRNGPTGSFNLAFLSEYTTFENLSNFEDSEMPEETM